jgi:hypothetical protein
MSGTKHRNENQNKDRNKSCEDQTNIYYVNLINKRRNNITDILCDCGCACACSGSWINKKKSKNILTIFLTSLEYTQIYYLCQRYVVQW